MKYIYLHALLNMKKTILSIFLFCICGSSSAQMYELGFLAGGSTFIGDIGATDYVKPNSLAYGVVFKYNINPRIALRTSVSRFKVVGDDAESSNLFRKQRGFYFENNINEFAIGIEYNFFEYDLSSSGKKGTPYLLFQLGAIEYKTPRGLDISGNPIFTDLTTLTIPMGLGYKSILFGKLAFAIEARVNYNLTDGLDYTTDKIPALDFGGSSDDWYVFTGVSFVYTFGRPSCYASGR